MQTLTAQTTAPTVEEDMPTIVYDASNPARVAVIFGGTIHQISDNNETVDLEHAVTAAGVAEGTPVSSVPTATFDDYLARFDTAGQNAAILSALGQILAKLPNGAVPIGDGPMTINLTGTIGAAAS